MTDAGANPPITPQAANTFIQGLLTFDKMIGSTLVKIVYYIGLAGIALGVVVAILGALQMMSYSAAGALGTILAALIGGAAAVLMWRFVSELWLLAFMIYARMGEIRDRLPPR
jgi:hypothetical protein